MGKKSEAKQGKKSRIADQEESRCPSENTDAEREENVINSSGHERKKKKKRKHESGRISDEFASTGNISENVNVRDDVENKREGWKKRKVEQDIDREEELEKPLKKDKNSRFEERSYTFHLTGEDSNDGVTRKKYEKEISAYGNDYDTQNKSEGLKSKKRKKEHKQNLVDDRRAGLGKGQGIIEVHWKKKEPSKQGEVETNQLDLGYGDSSKEEKMNEQEKEKMNKKEKKNRQKKQRKGDNEAESKDKLAKGEVETNHLDLGYGDSSKEEKMNEQEKEKMNKKEKKSKQKKQRKGDNEVESKDKLAKGSARKVRFADNLEVFPSLDCQSKGNAKENSRSRGNAKENSRSRGNAKEKQLVQGKRFTPEEDELIREAVFRFIEYNGLGENGLKMVLRCGEHAETRNCWKEIGAALPWRPHVSVYYRAHILFERSETRSWTEEEQELIRRFHEEHGSDWKTLADAMGKHRIHVKDKWRRIRLPNMKKGAWTQDEYQNLFDLVNMDLQMRALEERVSNHRILRDNISWEAISQKLATRNNTNCCIKWYNQLTSPMVAEGLWADADDYRLLSALVGLDACSMEEVDWDFLIENRSGDVCRKRWAQMVRHIGEHGKKSFVEQVEILSERYCPNLVEVREAVDKKRLED